MAWSPNQYYRFTLKEGMSGWDVWALQVSLNSLHIAPILTEDGTFGSATTGSIRSAQNVFRIISDGIAGPMTQNSICNLASSRAEKGRTPAGLLKGICLGESGGIISATTALYGDNGRDYGPFQDHLVNPTQAELRDAYNVSAAAVNTRGQVVSGYQFYHGQAGALEVEKAWRLAVLQHNWPAASDQIAAGHGDTWTYQSGGHSYKLADPAPWIQNIGVPGVTTGWQWCKFYIDSKITYVTNWSIA